MEKFSLSLSRVAATVFASALSRSRIPFRASLFCTHHQIMSPYVQILTWSKPTPKCPFYSIKTLHCSLEISRHHRLYLNGVIIFDIYIVLYLFMMYIIFDIVHISSWLRCPRWTALKLVCSYSTLELHTWIYTHSNKRCSMNSIFPYAASNQNE